MTRAPRLEPNSPTKQHRQRNMHQPTAKIGEWTRRELQRREHHETLSGLPLLYPAEWFSDEYCYDTHWSRVCAMEGQADRCDLRGPRSAPVQYVLSRCACGWKVPPTTEEVHEAFRSGAPDSRSRSLRQLIIAEANPLTLIGAYLSQAFTWRQVARHMHMQPTLPKHRIQMMRLRMRPLAPNEEDEWRKKLCNFHNRRPISGPLSTLISETRSPDLATALMRCSWVVAPYWPPGGAIGEVPTSTSSTRLERALPTSAEAGTTVWSARLSALKAS